MFSNLARLLLIAILAGSLSACGGASSDSQSGDPDATAADTTGAADADDADDKPKKKPRERSTTVDAARVAPLAILLDDP